MRVWVALAVLLIQPAGEPASFREGVVLLREGRLVEAEEAFLHALEESPAHAPSSVQLARLYAASGRNEEARRVLESALGRHPKGVVLLNELGSLLLANGLAPEAEPLFERALEVQPGNPRARLGHARSLAEAGKPLEALEELSRMEELGLAHPALEVYRASILALLGRREEAIEALEGTLERHPDAPEAHKQLGLLLAEERPAEALRHLTAAVSALSDDPAALSAAGLVAYALNRDAEATVWLTRAVAREPESPDAHMALGRIHYRRGDYERARSSFASALETPASGEAHFYLGEIELAALRFEQAAAHYQASHVPAARRGLARALLRLGRYQEAERALEEALAGESDPRSRATALSIRASLALERGDDNGALEALGEARRLDPHALETRYLLGTLLARLGRAAEAREELDAFMRLKALEEEKAKLELAILERPAEAESYRALVELYLREGRNDEARAFLRKALALTPQDAALLLLQKRLETAEPRC